MYILCFREHILKERSFIMKNYGYIRCSTAKSQGRQDTARQKRDIKALCNNDITFYEDYMSGSKVDRKGYKTMLSDIEGAISDGESDITIYCTEVSRLSRSMKQLIELIDFIQERHLKLVCGSFVLDCRIIDNQDGKIDPMADAMLKMMGIFAELERSMTIERINSGLDNARANGVQLGRKETTIDDIPNSFIKHYDKLASKQINVSEMARMCNLSRNSVYKYRKILESKDKKKSDN